MGKINYGSDYEYAGTRLRETLLVIDGRPQWCTDVLSNGMVCSMDPISGMDFDNVHLEDIDLTPPKMGFVNTETTCRWSCRLPARHYKQGLTEKNTFLEGGLSGIGLNSNPMYAMLRGQYPSMLDALDFIVNGEAKSQAFSRSMGLVKQVNGAVVSYRSTKVATIALGKDPKDFELKFLEEYNFLEDDFEELIAC